MTDWRYWKRKKMASSISDAHTGNMTAVCVSSTGAAAWKGGR